jgi:type VI protein secretion system component VasK
MLPSRLCASAAALAMVCAVAGCGSSSGSSGVSAAAYVKSICTAVVPFEKDVASRSTALGVAPLSTPAQGKQAIQGFLSAVAGDTTRALAELQIAGTPNVSNGKALASTVVGAFSALKSAVTRALHQANSLSTSSASAFKAGATGLGSTVRSSMTGIDASLGKLKSPELEKAAAKEPACASLGG